jgi:hypothetical protein
MSTVSPKFGFKIPEGTDVFDNDLYIKGNLNILDANAAKKSETIEAAGEKMEVIEVSFVCTGSTSNVTVLNKPFAKTYISPPVVLQANITQAVANGTDYMINPYIYGVTNTGFNVKIDTGVISGNQIIFTAGTIKMKFLVIGS